MTALSTFKFHRMKTTSRQRGQGMSEYIIIVALVAVVSIGVFSAFGKVIRQQVAGMAAELAGDDGTSAIAAAKTAAGDAKTAAEKKRTMGDYGGNNN
jgi:Flp pilus assembly pilin Flp